MDFACAPLFIYSTSAFAIFFLTQLHVIVFWTYFSYFLQPPNFVFFFSLLLCTFVLLCSLVAAFVFVLFLSHALAELWYFGVAIRALVFALWFSQLSIHNWVMYQERVTKKKVRTRRDARKK